MYLTIVHPHWKIKYPMIFLGVLVLGSCSNQTIPPKEQHSNNTLQQSNLKKVSYSVPSLTAQEPAQQQTQYPNIIKAELSPKTYKKDLKSNRSHYQAQYQAKKDKRIEERNLKEKRARYHAKFAAEQIRKKREKELDNKRAQYQARYLAEKARIKKIAKSEVSRKKPTSAYYQTRLKPTSSYYSANLKPTSYKPTSYQKKKRPAAYQYKARYQSASIKPISVSKKKRTNHASIYASNNRWSESKHYSLTGDFAQSRLAKSFIRHMVKRYGFEKNYLNKLFSNVNDTGLRVKSIKSIRKRSNRKGEWSRYRSFFLTPKHINAGTAFWKRNRHYLERAERIYGVPAQYIVGIIGVETIYGGNIGKYRAIDALATKAFIPNRRNKFYRTELEQFILMARREKLNPLALKGSTAGALGLCQFMPSNIKKLAVDFDNDGSVNLWTEADAIGSVAHYFKRHGWKKGAPVTVPVKVQGSRYKNLKAGYRAKYSRSKLKRYGITPPPKMGNSLHMIRLKKNNSEEVWVGSHNFYVITRYNHSTHYAMAVHQLGQRVKESVYGKKRHSLPRNSIQVNNQQLDMKAVQALLH